MNSKELKDLSNYKAILDDNINLKYTLQAVLKMDVEEFLQWREICKKY